MKKLMLISILISCSTVFINAQDIVTKTLSASWLMNDSEEEEYAIMYLFPDGIYIIDYYYGERTFDNMQHSEKGEWAVRGDNLIMVRTEQSDGDTKNFYKSSSQLYTSHQLYLDSDEDMIVMLWMDTSTFWVYLDKLK